MKKLLFITVFLFVGFQAFAQEEITSEVKNKKDYANGNNEIKLNVAYLLAGIPEIGYEYLINEESGVGLDIMFAVDNDIEFKFALTPYYRFYFGKKKAAGFYAEGFGMLNVIDYEYDYYYYGIDDTSMVYENDDSVTDFALGVAVGGKFLTNSGFIFQIYGGVGRNLFNNNTDNFVPRFGITFGKRF